MSIIHNNSELVKILGWTGSITYIVGYLLLSLKILKAEKTLYHVLNIIGAMGLICDAFYLNDYPNVIVNVVWGLIAIFAIMKNTKSSNNV